MTNTVVQVAGDPFLFIFGVFQKLFGKIHIGFFPEFTGEYIISVITTVEKGAGRKLEN